MNRNISKSRLEAITDGIIAIAATIMVLELHTPVTNDWAGLLEERTTLVAYLISFFMIYIVWRMHHDLFRAAEAISRRAFLYNGIWIFFLTLVPFTTGWVGSAPDANVHEELTMLVDEIQNAVAQNARVAQNQAEYQRHYDSLVRRYDEAKERYTELEERISDRLSRRETLTMFIKTLKKQDGVLAEFDEILWSSLVESVTVNSRENIVFTFRDGTEIGTGIE